MTANGATSNRQQAMIENQIHFIRGHSVMIDSDLALLYGVTTANLNKAVKRTIQRFPGDFMFQLTKEEVYFLIFQSGRSKTGRGGRRFRPYVFTQEGVAMLSSILRSSRAAEANVAIMRSFIRMRQMLSANRELLHKLQDLENKLSAHDYQIEEILRAIRGLMQSPDKPVPRIGYKP